MGRLTGRRVPLRALTGRDEFVTACAALGTLDIVPTSPTSPGSEPSESAAPATPRTPASPRNSSGRRRGGLRSVLTPGWILTAVLVLTFTYFAFTFLAPWQLGKNRDKNEFNQRLEHALEIDPVPISDVIPADGASAGVDSEWTRVKLQGHFLPDKQVLLRNRPVNSSPAYQSLTPFALDSGGTVMVNRGWVPAGDGSSKPAVPAPPSKDITVTGFIRMNEPKPQTTPAKVNGFTQVTGMNTQQVGQATGTKLATDYVQLDKPSVDKVNELTPSPDKLNALELPHLDGGTNLSYGIQWIAFGILAPVGLGWFIFSEIRERRREKEEIAESQHSAARSVDPRPITPGTTAPDTPAEDAPANDLSGTKTEDGSGAASNITASEKLANRYGGTRSRFEERRAQKKGQERF